MTREQRRRKQRQIMQILTGLCFLALMALILGGMLFGVLLSHAESAEAAPDTPCPVEESTEVEPQEADENVLIEAALLARATKLENVTVTHYDCCVKCCGNADGITASGRTATPYVTVAVDPDVIPLGSDVLVDYGDGELHYYRADDTGSAVKGLHIDLCVSDHAEALELGCTTATVYVVEEG